MYWQAENAFLKLIVRLKLNHSLLKLLIKSIHAALALVVVNNALKIKTNVQNAQFLNKFFFINNFNIIQ